MVLFQMTMKCWAGFSSSLVRLREFCAMVTKIKSTFLHSVERHGLKVSTSFGSSMALLFGASNWQIILII